MVYDAPMNTPPTLPKLGPAKVQAYADTNGVPPTNLPASRPETVRLTIPVPVRVHEAFTRISKATSVPVGRCMGDWMRDTIDAAEYMADQLEGARAAPRIVAQKLHAYALGVTDETSAVLQMMRAAGKQDRATARAGAVAGTARAGAGAAGGSPPSCNTGGKVPSGPSRGRGGKSK